jgi:hypothetical protein
MKEVMTALSSLSASMRSYAALVLWQWAGIATTRGSLTSTGSSALGGSPTVVNALHAVLCCPGGASRPHAPTTEEPYEETLPFVSQVRQLVSNACKMYLDSLCAAVRD